MQVSVADLFQDMKKQRRLTAEELFEVVRDLYIQGNQEIIVRARTKPDIV
jgi:hypothetical protein